MISTPPTCIDWVEWSRDQRDAAVEALASGDCQGARVLGRTALFALSAVGPGTEADRSSILLVLSEIEENADDLDMARKLATEAAEVLTRPDSTAESDRLRLWCQVTTQLAKLDCRAGALTAAEARLLDMIDIAAAGLGEVEVISERLSRLESERRQDTKGI